MASWDESKVSMWLQSLHLGDYAGAFQSSGVDGQTLLALSEKDLEEDLGVTSAIHRKKILAHLVSAHNTSEAAQDVSVEQHRDEEIMPGHAHSTSMNKE